MNLMISGMAQVQEIKVAVAGGTGKLGQLIVTRLLAKPNVSLVLFARPGSAAKFSQSLISNPRVQVVELDLEKASEPELTQHLKGVHTILSTLLAGGSLLIDLQSRLLRAGKAAGISRFSPSDYSVSFLKIQPGEHPLLEARLAFKQILENDPSVKPIHFSTGVFSDSVYGKFIGYLDEANQQIKFYGTGDEKVQLTSYEDTAAYVAEVVADPSASGWFEFVGEESTMKKLAADYSLFTGKEFKPVSLGTQADLEALIKKLKEENPNNPWAYIPLQYQWAILSDKGHLNNVVNAKYPQVKPKTVLQFLREDQK